MRQTSPTPAPIAFIDLIAQRRRLGARIDEALLQVVNSGAYIMGPQVEAFEKELAAFGQAHRALACANGTDALLLPLMAWNVGPGDAVFCPSFTFAATAEVVALRGACPVFVDIDRRTYNMDPAHLEAAIQAVKAHGQLTPKAIIGVCLFGQPADYPALRRIADAHGLKLIADSAQGFGATIDGRHPIAWADVATTSFFPAKPLGCYGDGGAVLVRDDALWQLLDSIRWHGKGEDRYAYARIGINSRLDTVQAAILLEKLAIFPDEIDRRNAVAARYSARLQGVAATPGLAAGYRSTWAQYTIETDNRDDLMARLKDEGIPTAVYYPRPLHTQPAYQTCPRGPGGLPQSEAAAARVLSLPMHPYLDETVQDRIIEAVCRWARAD
jgi:UDP-2-acetamido-2-deoxy-ribo-hexuluronate aminotransferase